MARRALRLQQLRLGRDVTARETARAKLDRLRQMAGEAERENPEDPLRELLDLQRALRRLIRKTRPYRAAGLEINAAALIRRIDGLYQECRELLDHTTEETPL